MTNEPNQEITIEMFNKAVCETGEKILGFKKRKKEEWISSKTWDKISERKATKQKLNAAKSERIKRQIKLHHSELNKEVKKLCRKDKKAFVEKLADEAEEAAMRQDLPCIPSQRD